MENKQEGTGKEYWSDGTRYEGDFVNNMKHGNGKLSLPDGAVYLGEFYENQMHGKGYFINNSLNK